MNETIINNDCELSYLNTASYILNGVLMLATIYSEFAGLSKCKSHNGILDGVVKTIERTASKIEEKKTPKETEAEV